MSAYSPAARASATRVEDMLSGSVQYWRGTCGRPVVKWVQESSTSQPEASVTPENQTLSSPNSTILPARSRACRLRPEVARGFRQSGQERGSAVELELLVAPHTVGQLRHGGSGAMLPAVSSCATAPSADAYASRSSRSTLRTSVRPNGSRRVPRSPRMRRSIRNAGVNQAPSRSLLFMPWSRSTGGWRFQ